MTIADLVDAAAAIQAAKTPSQADKSKAVSDMMESWRGKPPNPDQIVVIEDESDPGIPVSSRLADGYSRLVAIGTIAVVDIPKRNLPQICGYFGLKNYSRGKTKLDCCKALVQWKLETKDQLMEPTFTMVPMTTSKNNKNFQGNYIRFTNCLFHPSVKAFYAKFYQQPNRNELTAGRVANQLLFEKAMELYNNGELEGNDHDPSWDVSVWQAEHSSLNTDSTDRFHPSKVSSQMPSWKTASHMIKTLHSEYKKMRTNWKRSGAHGQGDDVLAGMRADILDRDDIGSEDRERFIVSNQKCLYYFLLLQENGNELFNALSDELPLDCQLDTGLSQPRKASSTKSRRKQDYKARASAGGHDRGEYAVGSGLHSLSAVHRERNHFMFIADQRTAIAKIEEKRDKKLKEYRKVKRQEKEEKEAIKNGGIPASQDSLDSIMPTSASLRDEIKKLGQRLTDENAILQSYMNEVSKKPLPASTPPPTKQSASLPVTASVRTTDRNTDRQRHKKRDATAARMPINLADSDSDVEEDDPVVAKAKELMKKKKACRHLDYDSDSDSDDK